jgi:uncharacterized membrane protein
VADFASDLFTWASLGTLSGLTGATVVVTNTAARAFDWSPKWFGLVVAAALCIGIAAMNSSPVSGYVLALLNSCLVYLTAAGASSAGAAAVQPKGGGTLESIEVDEPSSKFFHRWF